MLALCSFVAASFAALPQSGADLTTAPSVKDVRSRLPAAELEAGATADFARDEHECAVCGRAPFVWDQVVVELGASVDLELARLL